MSQKILVFLAKKEALQAFTAPEAPQFTS